MSCASTFHPIMMARPPAERFSSTQVFRASSRAFLQSAPMLTCAIVAVDFLIWTLFMELPCKFSEYVHWRLFISSSVPPSACGAWPAHQLAWPLQTGIHLVATLIITTRVVYARLSPKDTLQEIFSMKSFEFAATLCRVTLVTIPFAILGPLGAVALLALVNDLIYIMQAYVPFVIVDTARHTVLVIVVAAGLLFVVGRFWGPLFLIVPLAAVELRGLSVFSERSTIHLALA